MDNRYERQILFNRIGDLGQSKMRNKHVLIVGAGALGSASAEALVRAGIGKLTIIDRDYVEWSNLQRQQLYCEEDAAQKMPKAIAAKNRLKRINSEAEIIGIVMDARSDNLDFIFQDIDVIVDGTDNFDIRFIMNDFSQKYGIPWIYGSCVGSFGACYTIIPGKTPCLHCLFKKVPISMVTCDTAGIIGPAVQMVAAYQVTEALKVLVEDYSSLRKTFLSFDLWNNQHTSITVDHAKMTNCDSCGESKTFPYLSFENQTKLEILCGRNTVQIRPSNNVKLNLEEIDKLFLKHGKVERNPYLLSCQLKEYRFVVFKDGRVMIHGTNNIQEAKKIYHSLLG